MVGMSGKASEPRRGQATQKKDFAGSVGSSAVGHGSSGPSKTQPSAEALHVAKILGDKYPTDLVEKISQMKAMLPGRSEEEISIALHDHDYDTTKAITALLDSDSQSSIQGEWTTKRKGRRSKGDGSSDLIIAPGDNRSSGRQGGGRTTNRAASQTVREGFGGSVVVTGEGGRGRGGKGRSGSSGRGRSASGRREREDRDAKRGEDRDGRRGEDREGKRGEDRDGRRGEDREGKREDRGGPRGERGARGEEREGKREDRGGPRGERGARGRNRGPRAAGRNRPRLAASGAGNLEEGGGLQEKPTPVPVATEVWEEQEPRPSTEWDDRHLLHHHLHPHQSDSIAMQHVPASTHPNPLDPAPGEPAWDSEAESKGSQPLFPEAIPFPPDTSLGAPASSLPLPGLPTASCAQPTALTATSPALPRQTSPGLSSHQPLMVGFQTGVHMLSNVPAHHSGRHRSRHKRLARSQIPSQPVEMPQGTYPEMSELGIAFVGLELQSHVLEPSLDEPPSTAAQEALLTTPTGIETRPPGDPVISTPLMSSFPAQFPDDAGIISISTASPYSTGMGSGKKLEAPPGLPHPMSSSLPRSITATSSLPHTSGSGSLSHSVVSGGTLPHSVVSSGSLLHSVGGSGSLPHSVITTSSLSHSAAPSGTLPHSVVTSGSLSHSVASSGSMQEPVATSSGLSPLANTTDPTAASQSQGSGSGVGQLLPPEPISLPPPSSLPSLLPSIDLPSATEHSKATHTHTTVTSQLLPHSFSSAGSSSVAPGGVPPELMSSQATLTSSSLATPSSKSLVSQPSSHHHSNHQPQLQTQLQGKHSSLQQQQQQQQAMIYPYMLQHPLMMPMSAYYDPSEMSRYQASVSMAYYQHQTTSDPTMATGMGRDHGGSGFGTEGGTGGAGGGKFGGRGADISTSTTPSNPPHSQQQGVQQGQMSHAAVFQHPYYGGNVIYPMHYGYGMPGFSHSLPKPSGGSSYPGGGVSSYQAPAGAGFGYEDVGGGAQDYKMYGGMPGGLGKPSSMASTATDVPTGGSYKHQGFDSGKTGSNYSAYNVPQGGYGFIPTGPMPLQMPPTYLPAHEGGGAGGGGGRGQKHSKNYGGSQLWSQAGH